MIDLNKIFITNSSIENPIDIVYTFVDPKDQKWQNKYYQYNQSIKKRRFDFGIEQILFSLNTIEKYASWINKIYIVSDNQKFNICSNFLNDRIVWIDHKDIIPQEFLPTFNSMVIESFLWRINNLSKYFLYINDDSFIGRPVFYHDFIDSISNKPIQFFKECQYHTDPWMMNIKNTNSLFKTFFPFDKDICPQHAPHFIDKDLLEETYDIFHKSLLKMYVNDKIRSYNEYSHNLLFLYAIYAIYKEKAINKKASFFSIKKITQNLMNEIKNHNRYKFYCFYYAPLTVQENNLYKDLQKIILT